MPLYLNMGLWEYGIEPTTRQPTAFVPTGSDSGGPDQQ